MLITALAWIYITLICWLWGMLIFYSLKRFTYEHEYPLPHFSIICILGLAAITCFGGLLSLFLPLGGGLSHLVIAIPPLLYILKNPRLIGFKVLKKQFPPLNKAVWFLLLVCCLMTLVMSTWKIIHPDTLAYHAQIIQWIEKYKVVPGLVHVENRLGLQNYWFIACAIFSFKFIEIEALTFINSTVLLWFFIFIAYKINNYFTQPGKTYEAFLWLILLALSIASYTQTRLTASSANPDFIAVILVWLILHLLVGKVSGKEPVVHFLLIIIFSVFAITIKLSVIPVFIAALYAGIRLIKIKKIKAALLAVGITTIMLIPLLTRNIITTGYIAFPSAFPDLVNTDWKYDKKKTILIKNFVTGYARAVREPSTEEIARGAHMKLNEWLPGWWKHLSIADKLICIILISSLLLALFSFKKIFYSDPGTMVALAIAFTGIIFWFIQAPDPRFGYGFIIGFPAIIAILVLPELHGKVKNIAKPLLLFSILAAGTLLGVYTVYRISNFFLPAQVLKPVGIESFPSETINCSGIKIQLALNREACGAISIPCVIENCERFIPRGEKINNGFKAK